MNLCISSYNSTKFYLFWSYIVRCKTCYIFLVDCFFYFNMTIFTANNAFYFKTIFLLVSIYLLHVFPSFSPTFMCEETLKYVSYKQCIITFSLCFSSIWQSQSFNWKALVIYIYLITNIFRNISTTLCYICLVFLCSFLPLFWP